MAPGKKKLSKQVRMGTGVMVMVTRTSTTGSVRFSLLLINRTIKAQIIWIRFRKGFDKVHRQEDKTRRTAALSPAAASQRNSPDNSSQP